MSKFLVFKESEISNFLFLIQLKNQENGKNKVLNGKNDKCLKSFFIILYI